MLTGAVRASLPPYFYNGMKAGNQMCIWCDSVTRASLLQDKESSKTKTKTKIKKWGQFVSVNKLYRSWKRKPKAGDGTALEMRRVT